MSRTFQMTLTQLVFIFTVVASAAMVGSLLWSQSATPVVSSAAPGCPAGQRTCEVTLSTDSEIMLITICSPPGSCLEQFSPLSVRR